jgi:serine/threonine-protein kinase
MAHARDDSTGRAKPADLTMDAKKQALRPCVTTTPLAGMSWVTPEWRAEQGEEVSGVKDVAARRRLGNSLLVPEAHAGMMVTPSVRLLRPLGEGGMGAVWVAEHLALHTQVVVKFIADGLKDSKDATERFSREAAAAAQVKSPHVVQTFDHGVTADGVPYIVMELLEGRDLGHHIETTGRCPPPVVVEVLAQLGRALDRAHERGIVHRDIKPGNIFLCDDNRGEVFVKLLDFGIAKGVDVPHLDSGTKTGAMIGSPFYMSPEQITGSKFVDRRSDLWSVGVVAYEMLTGQKPFDAETMGGLAIRIHSEPLPLPSQKVPSLPLAVDAWFARACARNVEERFTSGRDMADSLAAALGGVPPSVDRPRLQTGPRSEVAGAPTMAAGAITEAGVVRTASTRTTRSRVAAVAVFGVCLSLGTWGLIHTLRRGDTPTAREVTSADSHPADKNAPPVVTAEPAPTTPPVVSASAAPAPPASERPVLPAKRPVPVRATKSAAAAAPISPPPPAPSATVVAPAPAKTGHDIF